MFINARGDDGGARDVGVEDKDAGELGKPFTQTEDDEEWVGWPSTGKRSTHRPRVRAAALEWCTCQKRQVH